MRGERTISMGVVAADCLISSTILSIMIGHRFGSFWGWLVFVAIWCCSALVSYHIRKIQGE